MKVFLLFFVLLSFTTTAQNLAIDPTNIYPKVKFETSMGDIILELDRVKAPITVDNFLMYVVNGRYNGTIFHRIIPNFIVQGGGYDTEFGPIKIYDDIVNESGNGSKNELASIAMAKESRPHTANSQFFFNAGDNKNLDPGRQWGYTVFGSIVEGEEVMKAMAEVNTHFDESLNWDDVPVKPVILVKATMLHEDK
jgi:peptidyl-prolyl cis-trans isomerase A (cyclophilin A)